MNQGSTTERPAATAARMTATSVTPITIKTAAGITGRTPWDIYERTESGELAFAMLNGRRFVALEDVRELKTGARRAAIAARAGGGGGVIAEAREAMGVTQAQMAAVVGISRSALGRLERDEREMDKGLLHRVACAMGRHAAARYDAQEAQR